MTKRLRVIAIVIGLLAVFSGNVSAYSEEKLNVTIIEGNKKETNENYDKVLEDCLTAIVNTINSQGVNTISVTSNTQNTETTK